MLAYTQHGPDTLPPVVFLHGFLGAAGDWDEAAPALQEDYRCIQVDLPGHGRSASFTVTGMAEAARAVVDLLDALRLDAVAVVGYSMGGRLALYLALEYPDRITRAVIESASPGLRTEEERAARRQQDEKLATQLETIAFPVVLAQWYTQPLFAKLYTKDRARFTDMLERRVRNSPRALAVAMRALGAGSQPSLWEKLPDCRVPMLLLAGEEDAKYVSLAREMNRIAPNTAVQLVPGCGHNVHFENPAEYTRRVKESLGGR